MHYLYLCPGWSDSDGKSDNKVFKELLSHMQNNKLPMVKAVVWCVLPQPRMDSTLQAQAKFIDMFTVDNEKGKIWSNVVIICKGKVKICFSLMLRFKEFTSS
jgi:hypothetical protein